MFKIICIPLLQLSSNIYSFFSGVLVSLSTSILIALCYEPFNISIQWNQFISMIMFFLSSISCMVISTRASRIQIYLNKENITEKDKRIQVIEDLTHCSVTSEFCKKNKIKWLFTYFCLFVSFIIAFFSLMLNWIL